MRRMKSHGGKQKVLASKQECCVEKQDEKTKPRKQEEWQRDQVVGRFGCETRDREDRLRIILEHLEPTLHMRRVRQFCGWAQVIAAPISALAPQMRRLQSFVRPVAPSRAPIGRMRSRSP